MTNCQLCLDRTDITTVVYHDGERVTAYECDTCGDPVVVLDHHERDPTLETQAYALGVARGLFGPSVAFRECHHGMPAGHWAAHVDTT